MSFTILYTLLAEPFFRLLDFGVLATFTLPLIHPVYPQTFAWFCVLQSFQGKAKSMFIARCIMGNVKMANITSNISTMLLRLLFSTAKHMSSQGTNFNYEYETIRTCARYHRRSWNSLWAKLLTANWKRQFPTRSLSYIFWSHLPK